MNDERQIIAWIKDDPLRMEALELAASMQLKDWCLAAGFVRNLIWDRLHAYRASTPMNDIDLIHFDRDRVPTEFDDAIERRLRAASALPWSVKNQAKMHLRNGDAAYRSTEHAMEHWVELETAVGARLLASGCIEIVAPFGVARLFEGTITINAKRPKPEDFKRRIQTKRWLELWPKLSVRPQAWT